MQGYGNGTGTMRQQMILPNGTQPGVPNGPYGPGYAPRAPPPAYYHQQQAGSVQPQFAPHPVQQQQRELSYLE